MKHKYTENMDINFSKLMDRIIKVNDPVIGKQESIRKILLLLSKQKSPTLIMATGGSKIVAYFLQFILEKLKIVCEVIEPRDYFYKENKELFDNLIIISASGNTNGVNEVLKNFNGKKYLICEKEREEDFEVISWGNDAFEHEKSFISLSSSLCPITLMLCGILSLNHKLSPYEIGKINNKIKLLLLKSASEINNLQVNFKDIDLIQIMSGYETKTSSSVLESNLIETGLLIPIVHDKGSFCHGRSNLLFRYPFSHIIYLAHELKDLDNLIIDTIKLRYNNLSLISTSSLNDNIFWKTYYLILEMYFLSKKIAKDKCLDLTMPEYDRVLVKKLYNFKGEM